MSDNTHSAADSFELGQPNNNNSANHTGFLSKRRIGAVTRLTSLKQIPARVRTEGDVNRNYPPEVTTLRTSSDSTVHHHDLFRRCLKRRFPAEDFHENPLLYPGSPQRSSAYKSGTFQRKLRDAIGKFARALMAPFELIWSMFVLIYAVARVCYFKILEAARRRTIRYWLIEKVPLIREIYDMILSLLYNDKKKDAGVRQPKYSKKTTASLILTELSGGCIEGIMALPQSMSYAMLALLPPVQGLYNQAIFPFFFAPFTTAPTIAAGCSAIENLMAGDSITRLLGGQIGTDEERVNCASALTIAIGITMFCMYITRLGVISSLLPDPVIEGFSTASAFVIGISQLKHVLGIDNVSSALSPLGTVIYLLQHFNETNWYSTLIGATSLAFLLWMKRVNARCPKAPIPWPLVVVIVGILCTFYMGLDKEPYNVSVVGRIPAGLPAPRIPKIYNINYLEDDDFRVPKFYDLIREGILLGLLYFIVHVSIARTVSFRTGKAVDPNQELLALSVTNVSGSFFQTFPNASSLSRTSVVTSLGCLLSIHSIVGAAFVCLVVSYATTLFTYLPFACLGAIVLSGVSGMVSFRDLKSLYVHQLGILNPHRNDEASLLCKDFVLWLSAFIVTIVLGALQGILFSLILSVIFIVAGNSRPPTAVLGRLPGCNIFRNVKRFPMAESLPGMTIFRFDASLNFSNSEFFRSLLMSKCDELNNQGVPMGKHDLESSDDQGCHPILPGQTAFISQNLQSCFVSTQSAIEPHSGEIIDSDVSSRWCFPPVVIIDASSMNELDLTAVRMLEKVIPLVEKKGVLLLLANWKGPVRDFLDFCDFYKTLPPDHCFLGIYDAVITGITYQNNISKVVFGDRFPGAVYGDDMSHDHSPIVAAFSANNSPMLTHPEIPDSRKISRTQIKPDKRAIQIIYEDGAMTPNPRLHHYHVEQHGSALPNSEPQADDESSL